MNNPSYLRSTEYEYDRSRGKIHVAERDGMEVVGGGTESGYGIRGYRSSAQLRFPSLIQNHPSLVLHNFTNELGWKLNSMTALLRMSIGLHGR